MPVKHGTASAYIFDVSDEMLRLALVRHPRLSMWMVPGGHVERDETAAEAVVREVEEELACAIRLLEPPTSPLPADFPYVAEAAPWWVVELQVPADSHEYQPHVHVDHVYVATVVGVNPLPGVVPAHESRWCSIDEFATLDMFEDSRILAKDLFQRIAVSVADVRDSAIVGVHRSKAETGLS